MVYTSPNNGGKKLKVHKEREIRSRILSHSEQKIGCKILIALQILQYLSIKCEKLLQPLTCHY